MWDGDETIIHALWDYPKARAVLSSSGSDGHLLDSAFERCIDWLEDATRLLDLKAFENLIWSFGIFEIVATMLCSARRRRMLG